MATCTTTALYLRGHERGVDFASSAVYVGLANVSMADEWQAATVPRRVFRTFAPAQFCCEFDAEFGRIEAEAIAASAVRGMPPPTAPDSVRLINSFLMWRILPA